MIRNWIAALALACSSLAIAAPVSLELKGVTVPEMCDLVFKHMLRRDYMLGAGIQPGEPRITISVAAIDQAKVLPLVATALEGYGIVVDASQPVVRVYRPSEQVGRGGGSGGGVVSDAKESCPTCAPGVHGRPTSAAVPASSPVDFEVYQPKGRTVEFLASLAKLAGATVNEAKGKTDVLVFGGEKKTLERVRKLLAEVDTVMPGFVVKAALVEYSETHSEAKSLSAVISLLSHRLGATYAAGPALANSITYKGTQLQAALSAIEGDSRFRYVAEPSLRVAEGERARLVVGSEVPTRGQVTYDKNGNPVQGIEYRTSGVVVTVEPKRVGERVQVKIGQAISNFAPTTTSNIDSPTLFKREAETTVQASPGDLIVLAGMDESKDSDSEGGFSWLPNWLHSASKERTRSQLVLLLEIQPDS